MEDVPLLADAHADGGVAGLLMGGAVTVYLVFGMMVATDYINILTTGRLVRWLHEHRLRQYVVAALLGATPGCAGAFAVVSLYAHGMISLGAVAGCMVATSGDESFVMLSRFPATALLLFAALFVYGVAAGFLSDLVWRKGSAACRLMPHTPPHQGHCECVAFGAVRRDPGWERAPLALVSVGVGAFAVHRLTGAQAHADWELVPAWLLLGVSAFLLFAAASASREYIRGHIFRHVLGGHVWKVALWVFGALFVARFLKQTALEAWIRGHPGWVMPAAGLVGVVPESGPHLVFVELFREGIVPLSVLVCSSVVQDGHGMLPLFSHSVRDALRVKVVNLLLGLGAGFLLFAFRL